MGRIELDRGSLKLLSEGAGDMVVCDCFDGLLVGLFCVSELEDGGDENPLVGNNDGYEEG